MTLRRTVIQSLALTGFLVAPGLAFTGLALAQNINPYPLDPGHAESAPIAEALTTIDSVREERAEPPEPLIHLDDDYRQKPAPLSARMSAPELTDGPVEMDIHAGLPDEPPMMEPAPATAPQEPEQPKNWGGPTWNAKGGEDVRDVLARWSGKAGVTLVWDSETGFAVPETVNYASTYESAVRSLLAQYKGGEVRPYGVLNVEPNTGGRTLTIDSGPG